MAEGSEALEGRPATEAEKRSVMPRVPETDERCPSCSDDISGQGGWCATCDG